MGDHPAESKEPCPKSVWGASRAFNLWMERSQVCQRKAAGARDSFAGFLTLTGKIHRSDHKIEWQRRPVC